MLAGAASALLDVVLPARCAGCGGDGALTRALCAGCRGVLRAAVPVRSASGDPPRFAAAAYDGVVRAALLAYKERGRLALQRDLGGCLARGCLAAVASGHIDLEGLSLAPVLVVPVPSRRATTRARGHDVVGRLGAVAARELRGLGVPARAVAALSHNRRVEDQAGLDLAARRANLEGAFAVKRRIEVEGRQVVVVDDIVTTGATAMEATRALNVRGAQVCALVTVAATLRVFPVRG